MGSKVTALEERGRDRVAVFVDGREAFTVPAEMVSRLGLAVGSALPEERLSTLEDSADLRRARDAALRLLAVRARSAHELRDRLRRKGIDDETVAAVLDALASVGLVDDRAFARLWIEERVRLRPLGRRRAVSELRAKGIDPAVAEGAAAEVYAEHPEEDLAARALRPKLRGAGGEDRLRRRRRLHAFLVRRGFTHELASRTLDEAEQASRSERDA